MHIIISLVEFLKHINYESIQQLDSPKIRNVVHALKIQNIKFLSGKDLLKINVESEGTRLKVCDESILKLALNRIWAEDPILQHNFSALADEINNANVNRKRTFEENLSRIIQLESQEVDGNTFADYFFNGDKFLFQVQ
jgi:hypothetical protein